MEREIQSETMRLEQLRERAESKRKEVVAAKQETTAIEKLREKKARDYQKALEKVKRHLLRNLSVQAE
mgnify:CR=1 FL=1